jgi:tRNA threonylcarbamoyladenosine biosynthesis protein TsaE
MTPSIRTASESETAETGRRLAERLGAGAIVLLSGDLGTGKTAFVRGMAAGLGIDTAEVSSPTFTLIQEYRGGRVPLYHADLYRLSSREADELGLDDLADAGGVLAVEWPERRERWPEGATAVRIEHCGGEARLIEIDEPEAARHSER